MFKPGINITSSPSNKQISCTFNTHSICYGSLKLNQNKKKIDFSHNRQVEWIVKIDSYCETSVCSYYTSSTQNGHKMESIIQFFLELTKANRFLNGLKSWLKLNKLAPIYLRACVIFINFPLRMPCHWFVFYINGVISFEWPKNKTCFFLIDAE